ncbi:unnamed protein product, partial [Heterosigma akashiwo]
QVFIERKFHRPHKKIQLRHDWSKLPITPKNSSSTVVQANHHVIHSRKSTLFVVPIRHVTQRSARSITAHQAVTQASITAQLRAEYNSSPNPYDSKPQGKR